MKNSLPKTGLPCKCKRGIQRNNCPDCEGTGWAIDWKAWHERNRIKMFFHCKRCIEEMPNGTSPRDWAQIEVGLTASGQIQVWCKRHEQEILTSPKVGSLPIPDCGCGEAH